MSNLTSNSHGIAANFISGLVTLLVAFTLTSLAHGKDVKSSNIKGYDFSVRDVQKFCMAKRAGGDSLSIHCKDKRLKPVGQSCEGWITGGLDEARLSCGGGLWVLNNKCKIEMLGASKGNVNCVFSSGARY